jgi:hypothetical protein
MTPQGFETIDAGPQGSVRLFAGSTCWDPAERRFSLVYMRTEGGVGRGGLQRLRARLGGVRPARSILVTHGAGLLGPWSQPEVVAGPSPTLGVDPTVEWFDGALQVSWHGGPRGRQWSTRLGDGSWSPPVTVCHGNEGDSTMVGGSPYLVYAEGQPGFQPGVVDSPIVVAEWSNDPRPTDTGLRVGTSELGRQDRTHMVEAPGGGCLLLFTPYAGGGARPLAAARAASPFGPFSPPVALAASDATGVGGDAVDKHNPYGLAASDGTVRVLYQRFDPGGSPATAPKYTLAWIASADGGASWSEPELLAYPRGVRSSSRPHLAEDRDPATGEPNGRLVLFTGFGNRGQAVLGCWPL